MRSLRMSFKPDIITVVKGIAMTARKGDFDMGFDRDKVVLPVGRSSFSDIRENDYYFIDKSCLIQELLETEGVQVTLITRPRRFGKTMAMSMISEFFDIRGDSGALFQGLAIARNEELCQAWMNQWPTVFLSFKSVDGLDFAGAYEQFASVLAETYKEHLYLLESESLSGYDKEFFDRIAADTADMKDVKQSLRKLTQMMEAHYGKPVILLIDEYDVPLAKASEKGYYREMMDVIRGIMQAMKDNTSLKFAVITGCLRIAKESIFTGTNNFVSDTISDTRLNEYFGFTQTEVDQLLRDTGLTSHQTEIKAWYDGYRFGDSHVYCPWDVMNHVRNLMLDPASKPKNFWENTSDNAIVRSFLDRHDLDVNEKFEALLAGEQINEPITDNLTYDVLDSSEENLWSLLYFTGYLTKAQVREPEAEGLPQERFPLRIPNAEVTDIFRKSVKNWFRDRQKESDRHTFFQALWAADAEKLTTMISDLLFDTISYHDYRESFYHAFLTGLLSNAGYSVRSNYESGLGRSDIVIKDRKNRRAVVIEAKWTDDEKRMELECDDALRQIEEKQYAREIKRAGFRTVERLGIAFFQKTCLVKRP